MANNLTLSVTLTGDGRQLSGTLKDAQNDVREFGTTTERESRKADTALTAPGRQAGTVSEHLRGAQREARTFGTETAQGGRQATQALTQTANQAQTASGHLDQLKAVAVGVGVAFATMGVREFVSNVYATVSSSQQLQAALKTVTGDINSASLAWDQMREFAKTTPFALEQSIQGFIRMKSLGLDPTEETMRSFANTAAAMNTDLMQMVEAVADATTGEFERLKEYGIKASKEGEQISFTFQGVTTRVQNSADDIQEYLKAIGNTTFADAAIDQMDTLGGKANNLQDEIKDLHLAIGEAGATELFERGLNSASGAVAALTDNIEVLAKGTAIITTAAGAYVAYRGVLASATVAQWAFNAAVRANPLGIAITLLGAAAGALYTYRDEVTLAGKESYQTSLDVDGLTSSFHLLTEAQQENKRASLTADLIEMRVEAGRLGSELVEVSRKVRNSGQLTPEGGALPIATPEDIQQGRELRQELGMLLSDIDNGSQLLSEYDQAMAALGQTTRDTDTRTRTLAETNDAASKAADELAKSTQAQADALENLYDRLIPGRRETVQLARDVGTLNLALATGRINAVQYMQAMGMLQESFQAAQRETESLADANGDAAQEMSREWERFGNSVDDTFADAFRGAFDSFEDFADQLKGAFENLLAELAYAAVKNEIKIQLGMGTSGPMQGGIGQLFGGGGGFNLSSLGSLKNGWDTVSGLWGTGSAASGSLAMQGGLSSAALASASQVASGAAYGGWAGSAASGAALGNAATGGLMGSMSSMMAAAGPALAIYAAASAGDSLLKNVGAYDALGIRTDGRSSQFLSQFMPIGGTVIGSALDAIGIGGRKTAPKFELATVGQDVDPGRRGLFENYGEGVYSRGALGTVGFYDPNTARLEETFGGFDNAKSFLDGITALDNAMVGAAVGMEGGAEKAQAMASAAQAVRLNASDAAGIANQLATRTLAVVDVLDGDFSASLRGLGLDAEQITGRVVQAANAMQLLDSSSALLNLQFDASAAGAMRAADGLAQLMGGIDSISAATSNYYNNWYSESERMQNLQADLTAEFAKYGQRLPQTRDEFRRLVRAQDLNTEAGRRHFAALMAVEPALNELANYYERLGDLGAAVNDVISGTDLSGLQSAYREFTRSLDAERQILQNAYSETTASIQSNIQTVRTAMQSAEQASRSLNNALQQAQSGTMYAREQGQATLRAMLAAGEIADQDELNRALQAVAEPSEGLFDTFLDYQRDQARTGNIIKDLEQLAGEQLSSEERSLLALEDQLTQAERQFDQEMTRLDNMLAAQDALIESEYGQLDWLETINSSVLSLNDALAALSDARTGGGSSSSSRIGQGGTGAGGRVTDADINWTIDQVRDSAGGINDAAARKLYEAALNTGTPLSRIEQTLPGAIDWVERAGLPKFRDGGIANGPMSGYPVELHGREAVIPLQNGPLPLEIRGGGDNGLLRAMNTLISRVERLEKELASHKPIHRATADHTNKLAKEAWRSRLKEDANA